MNPFRRVQVARRSRRTASAEGSRGASAADLRNLQAELHAIQEQAALKDKELDALRIKLVELEKKQFSDISSLRKDIGKKSGG